MGREDASFFGRVGHDLRGELSTVLAGVHFLLRYERGLSSSAREMLERVGGAGQRMKRLVDELDQAAWLEGESASFHTRPEISPEPYDLGGLCASALERVNASAPVRDVAVDIQPPDNPEPLMGSPELLLVALEQVIDFAMCRSRGGIVRIRSAVEEGRGVVTIEDQGGPVAADRIRSALEPFAEKELLPTGGGAPRRRERLGIGLAIADGILRAHGGGLFVTASPFGLTLRSVLGSAEASRLAPPPQAVGAK